MATNPQDTKARKSIGKFARALLATTCLTVATAGVAVASSITYAEGTSPAPSDFSNTFAGADHLTAGTISGTTIVNGGLFGADFLDYFELTGLGTGTFTVQAANTEGGGLDITIFNTSGSILEGPAAFSFGSAANFGAMNIPLDGNLVLETSGEGATYSVTVTTTAAATPEPGTVATAALGLAGAVALKRRRRKQ